MEPGLGWALPRVPVTCSICASVGMCRPGSVPQTRMSAEVRASRGLGSGTGRRAGLDRNGRHVTSMEWHPKYKLREGKEVGQRRARREKRRGRAGPGGSQGLTRPRR